MTRNISFMFFSVVFVLFFPYFASAKYFKFPIVPNSEITVGDYCKVKDPDFSEYRYPEEVAVCSRNVSLTLKNAIYRAYGIPEKCKHEYTIDHFIPLSLGGSNVFANLWPEHKAIKGIRSNLEIVLYRAILNGDIQQAQAIAKIKKEKLSPSGPIPDQKKFCK